MIRTALAMLATCTAANAEPQAKWQASTATLSAGPGNPIAYVDFTNGPDWGAGDTRMTLDLGGFEVVVIATVTMGMGGNPPDVYEVIPPEGYIAVPNILEVDENATGRVAIYSADGVGA
jgi:hypothetical protein